MEVASGKGRRRAGFVGRDRGILGVSYIDLSLPGAGGRGRPGSLLGLSGNRDGGNGARHRGQAHPVQPASVDHRAARTAAVESRAVTRHTDNLNHAMPVAAAGPEIERLIQLLARLPGLGPRSARRAALFLIKKREQIMAPLAAAMHTALEKI